MSFLLIFFLASCAENSDKGNDKKNKDTASVTVQESVEKKTVTSLDTGILTVANIRKSSDEKTVEILFNERASVYTLQASDKNAAIFSANFKSSTPLKVITANESGVIKMVEILKTDELSAFNKTLEKRITSAAPRRLPDIATLDTILFERKWPPVVVAPRACVRVLPNYATAVTIFNFCAAQSCNITSPPPTVNPCIPFQYVRDGCYARAHKMKWIIETRYNYCLQKVFSFANAGNDQLAVRANKWGGCCVTWWYHVAPLVLVQMPSGVMQYVIDPGMFNQPVPLATWLQAQQDRNCSSRARVSSYSVQPATAYAPANYQGTSFTTDPNYINTNSTLISYRNLRTCN